MKLELTVREQDELHSAILTRIRTVQGLLSSWENEKDEDSKFLFERYTQDLEVLRGLEIKVI